MGVNRIGVVQLFWRGLLSPTFLPVIVRQMDSMQGRNPRGEGFYLRLLAKVCR